MYTLTLIWGIVKQSLQNLAETLNNDPLENKTLENSLYQQLQPCPLAFRKKKLLKNIQWGISFVLRRNGYMFKKKGNQ